MLLSSRNLVPTPPRPPFDFRFVSFLDERTGPGFGRAGYHYFRVVEFPGSFMIVIVEFVWPVFCVSLGFFTRKKAKNRRIQISSNNVKKLRIINRLTSTGALYVAIEPPNIRNCCLLRSSFIRTSAKASLLCKKGSFSWKVVLFV